MNHIELIRARIQKIVEARKAATQGVWIAGADNSISTPLEPGIVRWVGEFGLGEDGVINSDFAALAANESDWLTTFAIEALEALGYYGDGTNFETVDEGRNFHSDWVVEEYNPTTVSGQPIGQTARSVIDRAAGKE